MDDDNAINKNVSTERAETGKEDEMRLMKRELRELKGVVVELRETVEKLSTAMMSLTPETGAVTAAAASSTSLKDAEVGEDGSSEGQENSEDIVPFYNTQIPSSGPSSTTDDGLVDNETTATHNNITDDEDIIRELFTDSSNRFLFMGTIQRLDATKYEVGCFHKVMALCVIAFQLFSYCVIAMLVVREAKTQNKERNSLTLEIDSRYCYDTTQYKDGFESPSPFGGGTWPFIFGDGISFHDENAQNTYAAFLSSDGYHNLRQANITTESLLDLIGCSDPTEAFNITDPDDVILLPVLVLTASFLLSAFLLPDVFESFVLLKCGDCKAKLVGALICLEAVVANGVAALGLIVLGQTGPLDGFLFCVGIIFIHEVDEQFVYLQNILERVKQKKYRCLELQFAIFFIFGYCVVEWIFTDLFVFSGLFWQPGYLCE